MKILLIEDNTDLASNIVDFLESRGYETCLADDGISGIELAKTGKNDLIILDLGLPGIDGISICKQIRREHNLETPVIMLTARDTENDKLLGFEVGADDYLVKPFSLAELDARIRAVASRCRLLDEPRELRIGDLFMNTDTMEVTREGQALKLYPTESRILEYLIRSSPKIVRREELQELIWGDKPDAGDALRSHIHMLRQALDKPFAKSMLITVPKTGYRLVDPS